MDLLICSLTMFHPWTTSGCNPKEMREERARRADEPRQNLILQRIKASCRD